MMKPMKPFPYQRFEQHDLILRDVLAIDRTFMANQRTLLGFQRTALTLLLAGVSLMKLFESTEMHMIGIGLSVAAIPVAIFGIWNYLRLRASIRPLYERD